MNIVSFAACSSGVSNESRWSTSPDSTGVSHVPHVPSWQEDSTATPASSTTSKIDFPGGTVSVRPDVASSTSNAPASTGSPTSLGVNRSTCNDPAGQPAQRCSTALSSGSGPQE